MIVGILAQVIEWFLSKFLVKKVEEIVEDAEAKGTAERDKASLEASKSDAEAKSALENVVSNTFGPTKTDTH